jgi:hypothetical protein
MSENRVEDSEIFIFGIRGEKVASMIATSTTPVGVVSIGIGNYEERHRALAPSSQKAKQKFPVSR